MLNYDLIAFDLDGTIFDGPNKFMRPRVEQIMVAAHNAGVKTAVASGRPVQMLGVDIASKPWIDAYITVNGACTVRASDEKILDQHVMTGWQALVIVECIERAAGGEVGWSVFAPGHASFNREQREMLARKNAAKGRPGASFIENSSSESGDIALMESIQAEVVKFARGVHKLGCMFNTVEERERVAQSLKDSGLADMLELALVGPTEYEITLKGVSKGAALKVLCRRLGVSEGRAVAFGDSGNDATFAQSSCTFVAMGNATPEIKAIADDVCPTVSEDGVGVWLEEHLGL